MLRLAVLGDPIAHSLSPRIQNAALAALGLAGGYEAIRCPAAALPARLAALAAAGYRGLNLTLPLKELAWALLAPAAASASEEARGLRAVNTLRLEDDGRWALHNTDLAGCRQAAAALLPEGLAGRRILLLGAGGAARAALAALLSAKVAALAVWNRDPARAERLLAELAASDSRASCATLVAGRCPPGFDLIIQATALGLAAADPLPPLPSPGERPAVLELQTASTPWLARCRAEGARGADGREMLLAQGAASFAFWTGQAAPLAAMRRALFTDSV
ncbi:shikimate dehydrogenase [bacterium]|nr:shikimate dehydrogenase [bacterium]